MFGDDSDDSPQKSMKQLLFTWPRGLSLSKIFYSFAHFAKTVHSFFWFFEALAQLFLHGRGLRYDGSCHSGCKNSKKRGANFSFCLF